MGLDELENIYTEGREALLKEAFISEEESFIDGWDRVFERD